MILNALARIIYYLGIVLAVAVIGGLVIGCLAWLACADARSFRGF